MEKVLEVKNLVKSYKGLRAVDDISFYVNAGEIVGLLGPNGAGKTSTINMILGLLEQDGGEIAVFGKDFKTNRSEILSKVSFAAVYAQLPGNLWVEQNLHVFALLYGIPSPEEKVRLLMQEFDLIQFARTKAAFLSSGEQSRLNLAKAMLNDPKLLLLDEPTASVDPSTSEILRRKILEYAHARATGVLWTSHDMYEIETVCDRVLFISHGKILLEGDPKKLPGQYGKKNLEELFITVAREPLSLYSKPRPLTAGHSPRSFRRKKRGSRAG